MLREDPSDFREKVRERIRLSNIPIISPFLNKHARKARHFSKQRSLYTNGNYEETIQYSGHDRSEFLAKRASETLKQLIQPMTPGPEIPEKRNSSSVKQEPRILFYLNNSLPHTHSGYTERTHKILLALQNQGVTIHATTRLGYPLLVGKLPHRKIEYVDGIPYERLIPVIYPRSLAAREDETVRQLLLVAHRFQPTALHTTTDYKNALIVSRVSRILGIPWFYEVRGELESTWLSRFPKAQQSENAKSDYYILAQRQELQAMQAASTVVSLSEVSKKSMIERGIRENKIVVVPNAINVNSVPKTYDKRAIRDELRLPDTTIIGSVTSVVGYEGLDDLVRATAMLPQVTCLIVGDGEARPRLEKLVRTLSLEKRVIFAGRQPNESIWKWYASLDIFILPRKDTKVTRIVTPIKALIAQALGIPIVASDLPAIREVTGNMETYVPPNNPSEIAAACLRTRSGSKQRREGIPRWDDNARELLQMYALFQ